MRYVEGNHFAFPDCPEQDCQVRIHNVRIGNVIHYAEHGAWTLAWGKYDGPTREWETPEAQWREAMAAQYDEHVSKCSYCQQGVESRQSGIQVIGPSS